MPFPPRVTAPYPILVENHNKIPICLCCLVSRNWRDQLREEIAAAAADIISMAAGFRMILLTYDSAGNCRFMIPPEFDDVGFHQTLFSYRHIKQN